LPARSTVDWSKVDLSILIDAPTRLDDAQLAQVDHIASLPLPALAPSSETHFLQCLRTLSLLPHRQEDDLSGELRLALYRKHFGHYSTAALSFLVEKATMECRFFPTPQECKAILDRWSRRDSPALAVEHARMMASRERQARFDALMVRFRDGEVTQDEVDKLPERWRRIAATRGYLWEENHQLRPVRKVGEIREGQSPAGLVGQHTGRGQGAGRPHERTGP
jgi:hypothetical protein